MKNKKINRRKNKTVYDVQQKAYQDLISILKKSDLDKIANEAKVSRQTLDNWIHKITKSPRYITMCKVAKAIGLEAHWVSSAKAKPNLYLVK